MANIFAIIQQATEPHVPIKTVGITTTEFALYSAIILILLGLVGHLFTELRRRDREDAAQANSGITAFNAKLSEVATRLSDVTIDFERAAAAIKDWANVSFVPRPEYESVVESIRGDMDIVRRDIAMHAERFTRDLDTHIRHCPRAITDIHQRGPM